MPTETAEKRSEQPSKLSPPLLHELLAQALRRSAPTDRAAVFRRGGRRERGGERSALQQLHGSDIVENRAKPRQPRLSGHVCPTARVVKGKRSV